MNYANLAQRTNFQAGSDKFENLPFFLTNVNIPGINFTLPEVGGRAGLKVGMQNDSITYNGLSFDMLIDEDFKIYHEFMDKVIQNLNVEKGTFADNTFDFFIEVNNNKGNNILKFDFFNCRIESIGDIFLSTQDDSTEHLLSVEIKFDYFNVTKNGQTVPVLITQ